MKRIINFKILDNHQIEFTFNDNTNKVIDFSPFIKDDKLSKPLADTSYFNKVQLYEIELEENLPQRDAPIAIGA